MKIPLTVKKIVLHTILALAAHCGLAQVNGIVPLALLRYQDNTFFDNPAAAVTLQASELKLVHAAYTGIASSVGLNYLNATFRIPSKKVSGVHAPGVIIHSEYDTDILKRTRAYLKYSWNSSISHNTRISAGVQFGFFNYSVKSSNSSAGISVFVPDANLGIWLHHKKINLGISIPQLLGSEVKPVNRIYRLNRYATANADYRIIATRKIEFIFGVKLYHNGGNYKGASISTQCLIAGNLATEVHYRINEGLAFSAGLVDFSLLNLKGALHFTYFHSSLNASLLNTDRMEIGFGFQLKPKETIPKED